MHDKKYRIGYTLGTYDMFHFVHLNLIRNAKAMCDNMIVGINSDAMVQEYKHKIRVISEIDRVEIVKEPRRVDGTVICNTLDKESMLEKVRFDSIFIGDDWKVNVRWSQTEKDLVPYGVDVVYLKHTDGVSSTLLKTRKENKVDD